MSRATDVFRNGELVAKHLADPLHASADASQGEELSLRGSLGEAPPASRLGL